MALLGQDDEFFGNDSDDSPAHDGLANAQAAALDEQFQKVGFHQTYDSSQETHLQQGFEQGYQETFVGARQLGTHLGRLALRHARTMNTDKKRRDSKTLDTTTTTTTATMTTTEHQGDSTTAIALAYQEAAQETRIFLEQVALSEYKQETFNEDLAALVTRVETIASS